jgi:hypothetical protein
MTISQVSRIVLSRIILPLFMGMALNSTTQPALASADELAKAKFLFFVDAKEDDVAHALENFSKEYGFRFYIIWPAANDRLSIRAEIENQNSGEFTVDNFLKKNEYICYYFLHGAHPQNVDEILNKFKDAFIALQARVLEEKRN